MSPEQPPPTSQDHPYAGAAAAACLLGVLTGPVGPLAVWLVYRQRSPLVDYYGKATMVFQTVLWAVVSIGVGVLGLLAGIGTVLAVWVAGVLVVVAMVCSTFFSLKAAGRADQGLPFAYPVVGLSLCGRENRLAFWSAAGQASGSQPPAPPPSG